MQTEANRYRKTTLSQVVFACLFPKCTHACKRIALAFRWNRVFLRTWVHLNFAPTCPPEIQCLSILQRQLVQFAPKRKETPLLEEFLPRL